MPFCPLIEFLFHTDIIIAFDFIRGDFLYLNFYERGKQMNELKFVQLQKDNRELFDMAKEVWLPFIREVNANDGEEETDDEILSGLKKRIHIQGSRKDMHFEIALYGNEVIGISMYAIDLGTVYGLLDKPGYGTVMGLYIRPEYRRCGFGRIFFKHIEAKLKEDGADKMYICPDPVTGEPFWKAMGFSDSGKFDPDDKKPIFIKEITKNEFFDRTSSIPHQKQLTQIITIQISKFLTNELVQKIAQKQWKTTAPSGINRSRQYIFDEIINKNDCFGVVAITPDNDVVGRLHCIKNEINPKLWYYGDLFVIPEYRRMGIASQMIRTAMNHLSELGAITLRCYVEPDNTPSRSLQLSVGFSEQPFETFNNFTNDGEIMYEAKVPNSLTVIPATENEAYFVRILFEQNKETLNTGNISLSKWKELLSANDTDEKHFLVCIGAMPVAYLKINGLKNASEAWISTLFVAKDFQHQGIGSFAITYAEEYVRAKGFATIAIQTDEDNLPAQNCYLKCGYHIFEKGSKIKFRKTL